MGPLGDRVMGVFCDGAVQLARSSSHGTRRYRISTEGESLSHYAAGLIDTKCRQNSETTETSWNFSFWVITVPQKKVV